jgi:hypothetical protein
MSTDSIKFGSGCMGSTMAHQPATDMPLLPLSVCLEDVLQVVEGQTYQETPENAVPYLLNYGNQLEDDDSNSVFINEMANWNVVDSNPISNYAPVANCDVDNFLDFSDQLEAADNAADDWDFSDLLDIGLVPDLQQPFNHVGGLA